MVVNWSGKKNNSKRSHHEVHAEDGGDVAQGPPSASTAPAPHPKRIKSSSSSSSSSSDDDDEASSGAERSRPLQSVGRRNQVFSWQPKKRSATAAYDSDSSSSEGELFK